MLLHPLCELFPRMSEGEFSALVADIRANGQRAAIITVDGAILDGGNRARACEQLGIEPRCREFDGGDMLAFVLGANLHRRHLTAGQQAAIVAAAQDWSEAASHGGTRTGEYVPQVMSSADRAQLSGAHLRTQQMADKLARDHPTLVAAVARGETTLKAATQVSRDSLGRGDQVSPDSLGRAGAKVPTQVFKPAKAEAPDALHRVAELEAHAAQLEKSLRETLRDNDAMGAVFDANDSLAVAMAENKKLRAQVSVLTERVNGLLNEKSAAVRQATSTQRKLDKAERELAALKVAAAV